MKKTIFAVILLLFCHLSYANADKITISGHIYDSQTGETLIGAGVILESDNTVGVVTNNFGYYSLTLSSEDVKDGKFSLIYSYVGYAQETVVFSAFKDAVRNITLVPSMEIEEAVAVAKKEAGISSSFIGALEVPVKAIKNTPAILGESDVLKAIQLLPGVQGGNEGFTGLYVRGGGPDENLILLDGVPVYNVDHMLGLFSVFQPEAVKKVTLYKGTFPASYGGRVSSVLDIRTNDGNMKETHGSVTLGLISNKLHVEGPIIKDKLSYSVSARGMLTACYAPVMRLFMKDQYVNYYFYDLNGKLTWRINDRDRLYFGIYNGKDSFKLKEEEEYDYTIHNPGDDYSYSYQSRTDVRLYWGNTVSSVRWNHIFDSKLFSNTTVAFNNYSSNLGSGMAETGKENGEPYKSYYNLAFNSGIRDFSAKTDFDYTPSPSHLIRFGAEYIYHTFRPESLNIITNEYESGAQQRDTTLNLLTDEDYFGHEASVYVSDDFSIGQHLTVNPGARLTYFNTQGRNYLSFQPRVSAKLTFGDVYFKAGYARMAQYVHLLSSAQISLPLDLWVPITSNIKPVTSDQFSVGVYYNKIRGWEFSLEGYYKEMNNILEYKDGALVLGSIGGWEDKVSMGKGYAYGAEIMVEKTLGALTGWLAYTLAKSEREFPDGSINNGKRYPYKYDRRHNININVNWELSKKVDLNATWSYASGCATTIAFRETSAFYPNESYDVTADYVDSRNNYRLPSSHRLNVGVNIHKFKPKHEGIWSIGVYNVYNRMNPNFAYLEYWEPNLHNPDHIGKPAGYYLNTITILPVVPSVSYTYKF